MNEKRVVGAPSKLGEPSRAVTVYLTERQIAFCARIGATNGRPNASNGVRIAIDTAMQKERDEIPFDGSLPFADELEDEGIPAQYGLQPAA